MLQTFFILAVAYAAVVATRKEGGASVHLMGAEALIGLAVGVRLDSVFALPAVGVLCLLGRRPVSGTLSLLVGIAPFLVLLSGI